MKQNTTLALVSRCLHAVNQERNVANKHVNNQLFRLLCNFSALITLDIDATKLGLHAKST